MEKKRVYIFGGGLAGLAAGIRLLEHGGAERLDVTMLCMEHRLGGKAASWRHPDGRFMEVGYHAVFGYYDRLQGLLARVGHPIDDPRWFSCNEGVHLMYEAGSRAVNRLQLPSGPLDVGALLHNGFLGYDGMSFTEKMAAATWLARTAAKILFGEYPEALDEHSFTAYAVATGLDLELTQKSWFKYILDLCFNYPNGGSTYVGMYGFQKLAGPENSSVYYYNGPMSEVLVAPVAKLFRDLGGKVEYCTKVTSVELDPRTRRLVGFETQRMGDIEAIPGAPDRVNVLGPQGYGLADQPYPVGDPAPPAGAVRRRYGLGSDFDDVIWTLPIDSTRALLRTTPHFHEAVMAQPALKRIWHLRTVASLSLRLWSPARLMPADYRTVVMGVPQPAATVIDYKNVVDEIRRDDRFGSVIELEGQEGLHGDFTDEELTRECLENLAGLPFVDRGKLDVEAALHGAGGFRVELRRNTAHHMRYILMEPGHWKHRPRQEDRPYENLCLAGDWVHSSQPTASTEAALRTGYVAGDWLRQRVGLPALGGG